MKRTMRTLLLGGLLAMVSQAETLVDVDFSAAKRPQEIPLTVTAESRVAGVLPEGWVDDSGWAKVWVSYSFGDEQGTRFLVSNATKIEDGRPQLAVYPVADAPGERVYRLTVTCRNRTGTGIEIGLRQRNKPWKFYWSRQERFALDWTTRTWEFRLPENDGPMGIWINSSATGEFHIAKLKLERFSDADLVAELKARWPDGGPANLVRVSRLPLGLPNGWALDRDSSDGDVAIAEAATAENALALRLASPEKVVLQSAPVGLVYPIVPHSASLAVRGTGEWQLDVFGPGLRQASRTFEATGEWQRIAVEFQPRMGNQFCQLRFAGIGELFIDKLQVGPTSKYTGRYVAPGACEVAVALAEGYDAGAARVVFDDESPKVDLAVTGATEGAQVHWQVFDVYGNMVREGKATAAPRLSVTDLPANYGSFRLEARVKRNGEWVSPWDEVVWHRLHRPRYWGKDAPRSPFAVHTNSTTRHILMAKAIGINWTRLHDAGLQYFGWWNLEPEKGKWRFFDRELLRYRTYGIKIFAELGTAPAWASYYQDTGRKEFGYFDKFFQPKSLDDYAGYVRAVCERYRDQIDAFDVWNEPWIHAWWGVAYDHEKGGRAGYITSKEPQADFARMMKVARDTARSIIPDATVMGFNTTAGGTTGDNNFGGSDWTRGVLAAGGMDNCDGIAYHCYTNGGVGYPGDSVEKGLEGAVSPIREKLGAVPKPIWMTEGSPLIYRMGNGLYRRTLPYASDDNFLDSSDRIARYCISMLANGVSRIFIYSMHGHGRFQLEPKRWNAFTTDEGYLHPSGAAQSQVAWMLEDTQFVEKLDIGRGVHAYLFQGDGRAVAAISSSPDYDPIPIPHASGIAATDLFGNALPADAAFGGHVVYLEAKSLEMLRKVLTK